MNRRGLAELNRRDFLGVQLEVVRLYRANGTLKEWLNPDVWISNISAAVQQANPRTGKRIGDRIVRETAQRSRANARRQVVPGRRPADP